MLLQLIYWPKSVCCQVIYKIDNSFTQDLIGRTVQIICVQNIATRHVVFLMAYNYTPGNYTYVGNIHVVRNLLVNGY